MLVDGSESEHGGSREMLIHGSKPCLNSIIVKKNLKNTAIGFKRLLGMFLLVTENLRNKCFLLKKII